MAREPHRSSEILDAVALLVVDMQDAFLNVMPDREAVLRRTALAIESARAFGIKVVFTEQVPSKLGRTNSELLARAPDARVFAKNEFSALLAEGLQEYLRKINVYHLLLAGIETPICIYQTALHAQDNDLDVTILSDCTTGRRPDDGIIVLEALARAECHVLPAETVFYSMLGSSLNPRFPHFTRIVKRYAAEGSLEGGPTPPPAPASRGEGGESRDRHERREPREQREQRPHRERHDHRDRDRDRHRGSEQRAPEPYADEVPDEVAENAEDLRAEDGISEQEADQPSYEEATAEHSDLDQPVAEGVSDVEHGDEARDLPTREISAASDEPPVDEDAVEDTGEDDTSESASAEDTSQKKKRPRRRRGGARRRRARERAAAGNVEPGKGENAAESADASAEPPASGENQPAPASTDTPPAE